MLQKQIEQDLLSAFKARDEKATSVLRMLKSSLINKMIEKKMAKNQSLDDVEVIAVIKSEAKKRKDSIEAYIQGNRNDLAQKEEEEIKILQKYLPEQLSEEQIREEIKVVIEKNQYGASDFGKAMSEVMAKTAGKADGQLAVKILKEELENK